MKKSPVFSLGLAVLIISAFSLIALKSLVSVPFYTSHDGLVHTARIAQYTLALRDGQIPPRWAVNFNRGLGSPIFVYSYPLPYLVGSLFHFLGFSYQEDFRLVLGLGYFLSGLTAFWWLRSRFGTVAGLVGAVFYLWVPYHFLNLYVRGALAENLAYFFVPLVFLAIEKIFSDRSLRKWWYLLVFAASGMLLSHNVVSAMFLPVFFLLLLGQVWFTRRGKPFLVSLSGLGVGFLLAGFIYFPDLFERNYIRFDNSISYWQDHFVTFWQFFRSPWGFGFDFPGTAQDQMSFQLGLAQIVTVALLVTVLSIRIFREELSFKIADAEGLFFLLVLAASVLLMLDNQLVKRLWEILPGIKTIVDFPWRFLGVTTVAFTFLSAYLVYLLRNNKILVAVLLAAVFLANRNHLWINQQLNSSDSFFEKFSDSGTAVTKEYTPRWRQTDYIPPAAVPPVEVIGGQITALPTSIRADRLEFRIEGSPPGDVRINRFYFPATTIEKDTKLLSQGRDFEIIAVKPDPEQIDIKKTGLIKLHVNSPGNFVLRFQETTLRLLADYLSLLTLLFVMIMLLKDVFSAKFLVGVKK